MFNLLQNVILTLNNNKIVRYFPATQPNEIK